MMESVELKTATLQDKKKQNKKRADREKTIEFWTKFSSIVFIFAVFESLVLRSFYFLMYVL